MLLQACIFFVNERHVGADFAPPFQLEPAALGFELVLGA